LRKGGKVHMLSSRAFVRQYFSAFSVPKLQWQF
jgi:hypothetical protein